MPVWSSASDDVTAAYRSDEVVDYSAYYNYMLDRNFTFVVMGGEFDTGDNEHDMVIWMKQTVNLGDDFWEQDRKVYYYQVDGQQKVGGYWVDNTAFNGSFTLMAVPKAGHFIPYNNYDASIKVLNDIVANNSLSCH